MPTLEPLRPQLKDVGDVLVQADGWALRMLWAGRLNQTVLQTLEDYGGLLVAEDDNQALRFFFSQDVFLAGARLAVWARFNMLHMYLRIFPARFLCGRANERTLIFDESLMLENLPQPAEFSVQAHRSQAETVGRIPGLSVKDQEADASDGMWLTVEADARLPYGSPLAWYAVLRPVGNPLDKAFMVGWREFFTHLESVLQRNKFRFLLHDNFLMFPLEGLRQVKNWCRDFLRLVQRLKESNPEQYWPCVTVVADRNGLNMNEDLPGKIDVPWKYLVPDYPHMSMRNALMAGDGFTVHEVRFAPATRSPDDWASLTLPETGSSGTAVLPQIVPVDLVFGSWPQCFYCGQRSHEAARCPSKKIDPEQAAVWPQIARMDFSGMRAGARGIEQGLAGAPDQAGKEARILAMLREDGETGNMLKAFYDINRVLQLRVVDFFWRARSKDLQKAAGRLAARDNNRIWGLLADFAVKEPEEVADEMQSLTLKNSRDYRELSLRGFKEAEAGNLDQANKLWKDAEFSAPHPVVQAWHVLLQGRALECQSRYMEAALLYEQAARTCQALHDAEYRRIVCLIKSGFTARALPLLTALITLNGHFFNKALFDPELERGYIQVMACLFTLWENMSAGAVEEEAHLVRMRDELGAWFLPDNDFAVQTTERIDKMLKLAAVKNFVAFQLLSNGRAQIEKDVQAYVLQESRLYKSRFKSFGERFKVIRDESAWFPFPRTLTEFNKSYNAGIANLNWAMTANFHGPENFRRAQALLEREEERLKKLEGRLRLLRIVRDATLFMLSMAETFLWLEAAGLIVIFAVLPLFLLYGDRLGLGNLVGVIAADRWQVQKALTLLVTGLVFAVASLKTILRFESIREKVLRKAMEAPAKSPAKAGIPRKAPLAKTKAGISSRASAAKAPAGSAPAAKGRRS
ncbi:MAG: tetratricopeptide repeat protein [Desulfovibrio sp.]|nr:tetratricopeptide repeat protein [Desulfovibrio sp.]